jgi:hypothetical protein
MRKFKVQIIQNPTTNRTVIREHFFDSRIEALKFSVDFNRHDNDPAVSKYLPKAEFVGPVTVNS